MKGVIDPKTLVTFSTSSSDASRAESRVVLQHLLARGKTRTDGARKICQGQHENLLQQDHLTTFRDTNGDPEYRTIEIELLSGDVSMLLCALGLRRHASLGSLKPMKDWCDRGRATPSRWLC